RGGSAIHLISWHSIDGSTSSSVNKTTPRHDRPFHAPRKEGRMIPDGISRFAVPSRSTAVVRRPYKPMVAGSTPAGRTVPTRLMPAPHPAAKPTPTRPPGGEAHRGAFKDPPAVTEVPFGRLPVKVQSPPARTAKVDNFVKPMWN